MFTEEAEAYNARVIALVTAVLALHLARVYLNPRSMLYSLVCLATVIGAILMFARVPGPWGYAVLGAQTFVLGFYPLRQSTPHALASVSLLFLCVIVQGTAADERWVLLLPAALYWIGWTARFPSEAALVFCAYLITLVLLGKVTIQTYWLGQLLLVLGDGLGF